MSDFIKGDVIILSVYDGLAYRPIACLTSNSLSETRNVIDSQTKCLPGAIERESGSYSYELSCEGNYIDSTSAEKPVGTPNPDLSKASHDFLRTLMSSGLKFFWKMDTGLIDVPEYYGEAILTDLSLDAEAGDSLSTFSGTLSGSGLIVTADPSA